MHACRAPASSRLRAAASGLVLVGFAASALASPAAAAAAPVRVAGVHAISGASPFPGGCGGSGVQTRDSEGEPHVAVNPRDSHNVLAVWQQDRFQVDGGALTNLVAV